MGEVDVLISEVGLRDGLQNTASIMPTRAKQEWIAAEAAAGVNEIEVGSFVPAKILPQLADTAELVTFAKQIKGLTVAVLAPNLKGAERAIQSGAHKLSIPFSVSETHSLKNVRKTHDEMMTEVQRINQLIKQQVDDQRPHFEVSLSTAFGCTLEGRIDESKVARFAEKLMQSGCDEVGLSDTSGYANPTQVKRLIKMIKNAVGDEGLTGIHLHNTRGLGLANVIAALECGITTIDSSLGGLGGCPFAPGASGNIVTEDLVFMLEAMGLKTGIALSKLLPIREIIQKALPDEPLYGFTPDAGLPKGFTQSS